MPEHANPNLLVYDQEGDGYAKYAFGSLSKSNSIDENGCWTFKFKLNTRSPMWKNRTNILFSLSANGVYTENLRIKTFIQIIQDSGL